MRDYDTGSSVDVHMDDAGSDDETSSSNQRDGDDDDDDDYDFRATVVRPSASLRQCDDDGDDDDDDDDGEPRAPAPVVDVASDDAPDAALQCAAGARCESGARERSDRLLLACTVCARHYHPTCAGSLIPASMQR